MARVVYLGDEVTAAGFRLAGLDARVPEPQEVANALRQAVDDGADCVLLSGTLAASVPPAMLEGLQEANHPLFACVPDIRGQGAPPDLARQVRNALGIDA
jgi:vacuolar-type H+-ATPase subunit F/Vma7